MKDDLKARLACAGIDYEEKDGKLHVGPEAALRCVFAKDNNCTTSVPILNVTPGSPCPWAPNEWKRAQLECPSYKIKTPTI